MWTAVRQRRLCGQCLLTVASLAHQGYATDPCGESFIMYDDDGRTIDFFPLVIGGYVTSRVREYTFIRKARGTKNTSRQCKKR
ncbi:hypothetical protein EDB86DRAFT_2909639 [Lactarius hatsudake]|nr:hypothetical protein EDB86DRAFT_2909639 [Lactarius hatsudake]